MFDQASYNKEGIVFHCDEPSELNSKLEAALKHPHTQKNIQKFIYFLRFQYLIEGSWRAWSRETVETVANRLLRIDKSPTEPGSH
jgi:capsular polysaccharide export protein